MTSFKANEQNVKLLGRTMEIDGVRYIDFTCSGIEFEFTGTKVSVVLCSDKEKWDDNLKAFAAIFVDDSKEPVKRFEVEQGVNTYCLYEGNEIRKVKIRLMKMSEAAFTKVGIKEIIIEGGNSITPTQNKKHRIEFIGDSITCGYGNEGIWNKDVFTTEQENAWEAYAAKTARYFDADFNCISWSGIGVVSSWTETDEANTDSLMPELYTYTDAALESSLGITDRQIWDSSRFETPLIVINLGTNDASFTKQLEERENIFAEGYYNFLKQIRKSNPNSKILCTLGSMGQDLCSSVEKAVENFKNTVDNNIDTMFFDVQNESDGIGTDWHPSIKTHQIMADKLTKKIEQLMGW